MTIAPLNYATLAPDRPRRRRRWLVAGLTCAALAWSPAFGPADAVVAARAALSGQALGQPKSRDGDVEAIRVLEVACRSATEDRIATLNQLRHLVICADDQVRSRFAGLSVARLTAEAAG